MRMSSSIGSILRPINTALFSSNRRFISSPALSPTRLTKVWCHSSSNSSNLHTQSTVSLPAKLEPFDEGKVSVLKQKMELLGVTCNHSWVPGRYYNLLCPKCNGGQSMERSLSFHIVQNWEFAMWRCFRIDCGWAGRVFADDREAENRAERKVKSSGELSEKSLGLVPLGEELIAYFRERMISEETLHRNSVMQLSGSKLVIAFTYRRNGLLVGCKYRTIEKKRFWQMKDTAKVLYGLDDIIDASEIIIVEGELDKLSVEEAGFPNCVSVPGGAPGKISHTLPSSEKDVAFQYLWNCKQYLDKVLASKLAKER
ncbi:twinkle homolog protein, chloroplastic/mitochondrial-like isoform X2 [Humulus lupulus]|uniref:twinkle homolog protein, chloroplastic/mitochondrial-like isoform X2 n=1 Tax=Humulus lupulus TaxID=3486 RepID=UPI002B4057D8|nr:twinkle homolog protein, chloroplastic/mitochondrial-like isoform X2 [Humulus lupulus]